MEAHRRNIEELDEEMKILIMRRFGEVREIYKIKRKQGIPFDDETRECYLVQQWPLEFQGMYYGMIQKMKLLVEQSVIEQDIRDLRDEIDMAKGLQ